MKRMPVLRILAVSLSLLIVGISEADDGKYHDSPHGSPTTGVFRISDHSRGSCAQCHSPHDVLSSRPYGLFDQNTNQLCFSASLGGCHADKPTGGSAGYPAQETDRMPAGSSDPGYFEYNAGGTRVAGVQNRVRWPGQLAWENAQFSPHYTSPAMPIKDGLGNGACDNCHNVHGGNGIHDLTDTTWQGIVGSQNGSLPANYDQCLGCHSQFGPPGMDDTSKTIAYYYDRSRNPDVHAGHGSRGNGYVPSNGRLPCYDCHNPHGSIGNGGAGGNKYLLSDQRPGWYGLDSIKTSNAQVRRFCFGCHQSSDGFGGGTVEGYTPTQLPGGVSAHQYTGSQHCYDGHGRDYTDPAGHNVHHPNVP